MTYENEAQLYSADMKRLKDGLLIVYFVYVVYVAMPCNYWVLWNI